MSVQAALISGGLGLLGQIPGIIASREQRRAGDELSDQILSDIEAGKFDTELTVSQDLIDATEQQKQALEQIRLDAGRRAQQALGGVTSSIRSGDTRTVAALPQFISSAMRAQTEADLAAAQGKSQADLALAQVAQNLRTQEETTNQALQTQVALSQLQAGQAAGTAGFVGEQGIYQNIAGIPSSVINAIIAGRGLQSGGNDEIV